MRHGVKKYPSTISCSPLFSVKLRFRTISHGIHTERQMGFDYGPRVWAAAAWAFGKEGFKLLLGARRTERLEKLQPKRESGRFQAIPFPGCRQTASVQEFVAWAKEKIVQSQSPKSKVDAAPGLHVLVMQAALGLEPVIEGYED
jgi:hypothetical protein